MKNLAGCGYAALGARDAARRPRVVAAVATVVALSLSIATPGVMAAGNAPASAVVTAAVGGLVTGKPRLRLTIDTQGTLPVSAVTISLPSGLSFSDKAAALDHGVRVASDATRSSLRKGQLTVTLHRASPSFVLTVRGPALTESTRLVDTVRKLVRFNEAHLGNQRIVELPLTITLAGAKHSSLRLPTTIAFR